MFPFRENEPPRQPVSVIGEDTVEVEEPVCSTFTQLALRLMSEHERVLNQLSALQIEHSRLRGTPELTTSSFEIGRPQKLAQKSDMFSQPSPPWDMYASSRPTSRWEVFGARESSRSNPAKVVESVASSSKEKAQGQPAEGLKPSQTDSARQILEDMHWERARTTLYDEKCKRAASAIAKKVDKMRSEASTDSTPLWQQMLRGVVAHSWFEIFFGAMIVLNSAIIGVEVDVAARSHTSDSYLPFRVATYTFNFFFIIELLMRIGAKGRDFILEVDNRYWNLFDTAIVLCAVTETILVIEAGHEDGQLQTASLRSVRILRLLRLLRVLRVSRLLHLIRALRTLVTSIVSTLRSLAWAMVLLTLLLFAFATLLTQASVDFILDQEENGGTAEDVSYWFGDLSTTFFTLFMSISGGISWNDAVVPLKRVGSFWVAVFTFYVAFTYFAVLNVVTGVFCETAISSQQQDQDHMMFLTMKNKQEYVRRLRDLFASVDEDKSGCITFDEFYERVTDEKVLAYFEVLGLDVSDPKAFFRLLDTDSGGYIDVEELLHGCLRMRGNAKATDMVELRRESRMTLSLVREMFHVWEEILGVKSKERKASQMSFELPAEVVDGTFGSSGRTVKTDRSSAP